MKRVMTALAVCIFATWVVRAQDQISADLSTLAETERAFAQAATQKGIRDSFLEYFADDAIAFNPAPISAKEKLRSRPARPFSDYELRWEPRTGDVAASGELGWLTGSLHLYRSHQAERDAPARELPVGVAAPAGRCVAGVHRYRIGATASGAVRAGFHAISFQRPLCGRGAEDRLRGRVAHGR